MFCLDVHREDPSIKLTKLDLLNLYKGLKFILQEIFPSLRSLSNYFKSVAIICTKLGISIPWYLPTGLVYNKSYMQVKETWVKPLNFSNSIFQLRVLVGDSYDRNKQVRALMGSLIDSLDSTSLILLMNKYFYSFKLDTNNIYAIHDCFAVTPNHMDFIINTLKMVYIFLYSKVIYQN